MIMTEKYTKQKKLPLYKIIEDPTGLYDYDSHNLNLLGFDNEVPMLTLSLNPSRPTRKINILEQASQPNREINILEQASKPIRKINILRQKKVKSWKGKKLIIKGDAGVIKNKLVVVQYKNKKKGEIPGKSSNVNTSPGKAPIGGTELKVNRVENNFNYHVYKVKKPNCKPFTSDSSNNVESDHNYFTARRKSTESISSSEPSVIVKKNRSSSMSVQKSKKIVDKPLIEYKVYSRKQKDEREDLLGKTTLVKPVEALKILKIIKPHTSSTSPPPLEAIRPMANKVFQNRAIVLPKVDGGSQTTLITTATIGVNTDENLFNEFIDSKIEERNQNIDLDSQLENCLKDWDIFTCNDEFPNPLLNVQRNGQLMDMNYTNIANGSHCNAVSQYSNSTPMNWKMQLFLDLKKCDIVDMSGNRPLHLAVMQNNDRLVKRNCIALKARDIDINFTNNENLTALQLALMHNSDLVIVETLLRNNCDTLATDSEGNNILHLAVLYSNENVVRLLVATPDLCDVNACNFEGYTPLILCVINKRYVMADLLLSFDADPNIGDKKSGRTALFHAVEANDAEMVKLLINQKALTKVKNYFGTSPHDAMFELDSIDATIRKLVLNRDDVSSARPKIARGKRKRSGGGGGDRPKIYKPQ